MLVGMPSPVVLVRHVGREGRGPVGGDVRWLVMVIGGRGMHVAAMVDRLRVVGSISVRAMRYVVVMCFAAVMRYVAAMWNLLVVGFIMSRRVLIYGTAVAVIFRGERTIGRVVCSRQVRAEKPLLPYRGAGQDKRVRNQHRQQAKPCRARLHTENPPPLRDDPTSAAHSAPAGERRRDRMGNTSQMVHPAGHRV